MIFNLFIYLYGVLIKCVNPVSAVPDPNVGSQVGLNLILARMDDSQSGQYVSIKINSCILLDIHLTVVINRKSRLYIAYHTLVISRIS